ncbi:MAG: hypothetical protein GY771_17405, partial [bacterium]|nr:hypothetical protein [bacterium]
MKYVSSFLVMAIILTVIPEIGYGEHIISSKDKPEFLFVFSAKSGTFDGDTVTLKDVPLVIYFSDRPYRIAGHISLGEFVELWGEGTVSFEMDPPNATLSILKEDGNIDIVVELTNPKLMVDTLMYRVKVIDGELPKTFGESSIFIDDIDTPPGNHGI